MLWTEKCVTELLKKSHRQSEVSALPEGRRRALDPSNSSLNRDLPCFLKLFSAFLMLKSSSTYRFFLTELFGQTVHDVVVCTFKLSIDLVHLNMKRLKCLWMGL